LGSEQQKDKSMRIVTLEEHFAVPPLVARLDPAAIAARGWTSLPIFGAARPKNLSEVGAARLADMDEGGVTVQVLAMAGPGSELAGPDKSPEIARAYNDQLKQWVDAHPDRFAGFAHLPMSAPEAAADELERAVKDLGFRGAMINGLTDDLFLDDPSFEPVLARAAKLDVPLYLHPNIPPESVRKVYFAGLKNEDVPLVLGWCWHSETALHILRLAASGALDRHPNLKMIIGHMGEGLPAMMARCDMMSSFAKPAHRTRTVTQAILDQVWITTSGFSDLPSFTAAFSTFGADRIMFSVDYPFGGIAEQMKFLEGLPISPADRAKIAHGNADRLLKLNIPNA
jgi:hypothetical protein